MIIATAGHVDHGKTSLVGLLTGVQTDQLEEERARGLTIDLGFAHTTIQGASFGFVDVPGHIRFINNMLAGVSAVDLALLVVAADDGIMPQTREHLAILHALAVPQLIVVLTKSDRVAAEQCQTVTESINDLLTPTTYAGAKIVACSGVTGIGRQDLEKALIEASTEARLRSDVGYFRMAVDRVFTAKGAGTIVTGAIIDGSIAIADTIHEVSAQQPFKVRSIQRHGSASDIAMAGDRVALNLTGPQAGLKQLVRGAWLTANPTLRPHHHIDVLLHVQSTEVKPLRHWTPAHVYHSAQHTLGHLATLEAPKMLPNETGLVQVVCKAPLSACVGDKIIFRDQGATRTIASGIVVDPIAKGRGRAKPSRLKLLNALANAAHFDDYAQVCLDTMPGGVPVSDFARNLNWLPATIQAWLKNNKQTLLLDQCLVTKKAFDQAQTALIQGLSRFHKDNPAAEGMNVSALSGVLPRNYLFKTAIIDQLKKTGTIVVVGTIARLPGAIVKLPEATQRLLDRLRPLLAETPLQPPVIHDLSERLGVPPKSLLQQLQPAVKAGLLVQPVKNRLFLPESIQTFTSLITKLAGDNGFSVQQFRDAAGIGRNLCIELLEYFDGKGITRRDGNVRFLRI